MQPVNLLPELQARGLVAQCTNTPALAELLAIRSANPYVGFDPTNEFLTVGALMPLLMLRRFQRSGHAPIALVGGATGQIGDPSGKIKERQLNSKEQVQQWSESLQRQIEPFLDFGGSAAARVVNNLDWFGPMSALDFLRDIGKLVTVNTLLARDTVKQRMATSGPAKDAADVGAQELGDAGAVRAEGGMSFTEFAYPLLQGHDFVVLNRRFGCALQLGGSDQWGNIVQGVDMTRRINGADVHGLTSPLLTKADGSKFGKSEQGNVWLSAARTSPYAFFQFWLNTADADVQKYLQYFSALSVDDIRDLVECDRRSGAKPQAQRVLAEELTSLVHGHAAVQSAQRIGQALFSSDVSRLTETDLAQLAQDGLPTITAARAFGTALPALLVDAGLAESRTQARLLLQQNAISINGQAVGCETPMDEGLRLFGRYSLLKRGQKRHALVVWER